MLSLKNLSQAEFGKSQGNKIEREIPYFITIVTLLAASGLGPYSILQKIREVNLLPTIRAESIKIIKRIDLLGLDPLTALSQARDRPSSKALGEFLGGYVSAIQSGGNVVNYLKSKMSSAYQRLENKEKNSIERISGLVHAYLTIQIVILAVFILIAAVGSSPMSVLAGNVTATKISPPYPLMIFPPLMSVIFMIVARKMNYSNMSEVGMKKALTYALPSVLISAILILTKTFSSFHADAVILGIGLIGASIWPALKFKKIYSENNDAEAATPQILRDITEARKTGMGPEKCIVHACKRRDFKTFNTVSNAISNKLEWGIPLKNIFETLQSEVKNFQVLISFRILFEIVSSGGGNVNTLDSLADTSEKIHNIGKTKREMLKPYVMIGFMLVAITGFTTLLTIQSFGEINQQNTLGQQKISGGQDQTPSPETDSFMELVSLAVTVQAWLAGLFLGKITRGAYSGGFLFSIFLTVITMIGIILIQNHIVNLGSIIKTPT